MGTGWLSYNGATYTLSAEDVDRLLTHGVIVPDPTSRGSFELAPEHLIEELGDDVPVVTRISGAEARGEGTDTGRQRMIAVRFMHRDAQGGR